MTVGELEKRLASMPPSTASIPHRTSGFAEAMMETVRQQKERFREEQRRQLEAQRESAKRFFDAFMPKRQTATDSPILSNLVVKEGQ